MTLENFFKENNKVALGFSGGVDSSFLLYSAIKYGADITAYYIKTPFQPEFEYTDALKMVELLNAKLKVIELDVLGDETIKANPHNRCYFCKKAIFGAICVEAKKDGIPLVIDGTNASDDAGDRPGMQALGELSVRSPLCESGLTKDEIRRLSKEAGLFTWDKPAYACLATRIPENQQINTDLLTKIEKSEDCLRTLGFIDFRVRVYSGAARLQFPESQLIQAIEKREVIAEKLEQYFYPVLLDLSKIR